MKPTEPKIISTPQTDKGQRKERCFENIGIPIYSPDPNHLTMAMASADWNIQDDDLGEVRGIIRAEVLGCNHEVVVYMPEGESYSFLFRGYDMVAAALEAVKQMQANGEPRPRAGTDAWGVPLPPDDPIGKRYHLRAQQAQEKSEPTPSETPAPPTPTRKSEEEDDGDFVTGRNPDYESQNTESISTAMMIARMQQAQSKAYEVLMSDEPTFREPDEIRAETGWINPQGEVWHCGYYEHLGLAEVLATKFYPGFENGEKTLEERGWVKVTRTEAGYGDLYVQAPKYESRRVPVAIRRTLTQLSEAYLMAGDYKAVSGIDRALREWEALQ